MHRAATYTPAMTLTLAIVLLVAMAAVVVTLFAGLIGMARGGDFNARYGNVLMRWRVVLQGVAVLVLVIALIAASS